MQKIIADESIPYLADCLSSHVDLVSVPTNEIVPDLLQDADGLIVRSVTTVDHNLLAGSPVRWIGSATSGMDHIAIDVVQDDRIQVDAAPGCNARAVAEYVLCTIAALKADGYLPDRPSRIGIIGCGHVGQLVQQFCEALGMVCVCVDPLRPNFQSAKLEDCYDCDVITVHANLHQGPKHPSYRLINVDFLQKCQTGCVLINTSRGEIIDEMAFSQVARHVVPCLDVWQGEPQIHRVSLAVSTLATPHIAGHTLEAKWQASQRIAQLCSLFFDFPLADFQPDFLKTQKTVIQGDHWWEWLLAVYNIGQESQAMHRLLETPSTDVVDAFRQLRRQHQRRSFSAFTIDCPDDQKSLCRALGFASLGEV